MKLSKVKISSLVPDPENVRRHGERDLDFLGKSITDFGHVLPLLVQRGTNKIIAGNGQYEALRTLGRDTVDVVALDVDDATAAKLSLALNRSAELSAWDATKMAEALELHQWQPDDIGFTESELAAVLRPVESPATAGIDLGGVPPTVAENLDELRAIRNRGRDTVSNKSDTERYLVVVFESREAKHAMLAALGLPGDERYLPGSAISVTLKNKIAASHNKEAPKRHAGATG